MMLAPGPVPLRSAEPVAVQVKVDLFVNRLAQAGVQPNRAAGFLTDDSAALLRGFLAWNQPMGGGSVVIEVPPSGEAEARLRPVALPGAQLPPLEGRVICTMEGGRLAVRGVVALARDGEADMLLRPFAMITAPGVGATWFARGLYFVLPADTLEATVIVRISPAARETAPAPLLLERAERDYRIEGCFGE
jgi:hypothetical protein